MNRCRFVCQAPWLTEGQRRNARAHAIPTSAGCPRGRPEVRDATVDTNAGS